MAKYTKTELALEIEQAKRQLWEREREQSYELVLFGGGFCFDRYWFISAFKSLRKGQDWIWKLEI